MVGKSRLVAKLDGRPAGRQIRTHRLQLDGHPTPPAIDRAWTDLNRLLALTPHVRQMELVVRWGSIVDLDPAKAEDEGRRGADLPDRFSHFVEPALSGQVEVEAFSLSGVGSEPRVICGWIKRCVC